jgi:hypothetical protein
MPGLTQQNDFGPAVLQRMQSLVKGTAMANKHPLLLIG